MEPDGGGRGVPGRQGPNAKDAKEESRARSLRSDILGSFWGLFGDFSKFLFPEGSGAGISTPSASADPLLARAGTAASAVVVFALVAPHARLERTFVLQFDLHE